MPKPKGSQELEEAGGILAEIRRRYGVRGSWASDAIIGPIPEDVLAQCRQAAAVLRAHRLPLALCVILSAESFAILRDIAGPTWCRCATDEPERDRKLRELAALLRHIAASTDDVLVDPVTFRGALGVVGLSQL